MTPSMTLSGELTELIKGKVSQSNPGVSILSHPEMPETPKPTVYSDVTISEFIPYWNIIENVPEQSRETRNKPTWMEQLDINNGNGQGYGYIVYRKTLVLQAGMKLKIRGHPRDLVQVIFCCDNLCLWLKLV